MSGEIGQELSERVAEFIAANKLSPVVAGAVIDDGGKGAFYTLKNKRVFRLNAADCKAIGVPRWDLG